MCGIIAYIGEKQSISILLSALKRMEYRGYDSSGIAYISSEENKLHVIKKQGKISNLSAACKKSSNGTFSSSSVGIGHTRWATHGMPSDLNAHPHTNVWNSLCVVHNGIIENFQSLKKLLVNKGYTFRSDTDTEVLAHLIHDHIENSSTKILSQCISRALMQVEGTFGLAVLDENNPDIIVAARRGSPLILGVGDCELILASDAAAIVEHSRKVIYLEDNDMVTLSHDGCFQVAPIESYTQLPTLSRLKSEIRIRDLEITLESITKDGFDHFMLKEIYEQPNVVEDCMRGRVVVPPPVSAANSSREHDNQYCNNSNNNMNMNTSVVVPFQPRIQLGGVDDVMDVIAASHRIIITACGTSWHAGLVGEYLIEQLARIPVEVEYASEFRYRDPVLTKNDCVIAISQSGETADTLAAIRHAKSYGCLTIGFVNTVGSSIARETHSGVYLHVGPEIGVASTKAFTGQMCVLHMFALRLAQFTNSNNKSMVDSNILSQKILELHRLPSLIQKTLNRIGRDIASKVAAYKFCSNFIFLGRGVCFPVALEGALKLKEISYIHAEGYPAAEMKHGPIALVDPLIPVVFIVPKNDVMYEKVVGNIQEVLARNGTIIIITSEDNSDFDHYQHDNNNNNNNNNNTSNSNSILTIKLPMCSSDMFPFLAVLPLQLMAYYIAKSRGCDIDQPRNLAKCVTVE